jgi:chitin disaccharide deacetylase
MKPSWLEASVVLCADDFAYNAACSDAIARLAMAAKIDAVSAMVLSPRWALDAPLLHAVRGRISVGLHLDWTSEYAVAAGHGMSLTAAMLRAACGRLQGEKARSVIARQLDLFEQQWQTAPDHIDGHQHVQQFAGIRDALVQEISRRYTAAKPWLRISNPVHIQKSLKAHIIRAQGATKLIAAATATGIVCKPWLSGIYNFQGGAHHYAHLLSQWQTAAPPGTVVMCHPATSAEPGDSIGAARKWEYDVLTAQTHRQVMDIAQP